LNGKRARTTSDALGGEQKRDEYRISLKVFALGKVSSDAEIESVQVSSSSESQFSFFSLPSDANRKASSMIRPTIFDNDFF
jgi:hypothetical protein